MKVLRAMAASIGLAAALMVSGSERVAGAEAECPNECRAEINQLICREVVITIGGEVIDRKFYYWTRGTES